MSDDLVKRLRLLADRLYGNPSDLKTTFVREVAAAILLREAAERIEALESAADDLGWAATDAQDRRG